MGRETTGGPRPKPPQGAAAFDIRSLDDRFACAGLQAGVEKALRRLDVHSNDIADLSQEVMVQAERSRSRYDPALGTVQSWLEGIALFKVREHRRHWRKKLSRLVLSGIGEEIQAVAGGLNPEQEVHARRSLATLGEAMPSRLDVTFRMRALGHSREEIREETGLALGGVNGQVKQMGDLRDAAVVKNGEDPDDGSNVRFGVAPFLAFAACAQGSFPGAPEAEEGCPEPEAAEPPGGAEHGAPRPGITPSRGPWKTSLVRRAVAMMAGAAAIAATVPLAWTSLPELASTAPPPAPFREVPPPGPPAPTAEHAGLQLPSTLAPSSMPVRPTATPVAPGHSSPSRGTNTTTSSNRLLRLAGQALQSGAVSAALPAVADHARRFPEADAAHRAQLTEAAQRRVTTDARAARR